MIKIFGQIAVDAIVLGSVRFRTRRIVRKREFPKPDRDLEAGFFMTIDQILGVERGTVDDKSSLSAGVENPTVVEGSVHAEMGD